jgi:hypothetical protein
MKLKESDRPMQKMELFKSKITKRRNHKKVIQYTFKLLIMTYSLKLGT